ncbi:hypothetical protein [Streptomyces griseus]|uniref:hypothetical protein n=1 Tax=Streptomyces griseus TaxID=1911 RepID=UPI00055B5198|nr:hypothetical protein [Streptomyces griseus]
MGVLGSFWGHPRGRRVVALAGLAVVAVGGAVACDPGGLSAATVAYTTDETATKELERQKIDVRWLTCTANYKGNRSASPSASEDTVAKVDCQGETGDGKDITVTGKVTRAVNGACVRGDLTAKVGGKVRFHVSGLGDCEGTPSPVAPGPGNGGRPAPTVTVTVTTTIWCDQYPDCRPVQGK